MQRNFLVPEGRQDVARDVSPWKSRALDPQSPRRGRQEQHRVSASSQPAYWASMIIPFLSPLTGLFPVLNYHSRGSRPWLQPFARYAGCHACGGKSCISSLISCHSAQPRTQLPDAATGRSYRTQLPDALLLVPASRHRAGRQLSRGLAICAQWPRPEGPVADVPDAWGTLPMPPTGWPWPRLANHRPRCRRFEPVGTTPAASGLLDSAPSPRQRSAGGSFPLLLTRQALLRCRPPSAAGARGRAVG